MTDVRKMLRRVPRLRLALGVAALAAFVGGAIVLWAWRAGRLDTVDMSTALIVCIVVGIAAAGMALTYTPGPIPPGSSKTFVERSLSRRLVTSVVAGLFWTGFGTMQASRAFGEGDWLTGYGYGCLVLLWLCAAPMTLMRGHDGEKPGATDPDAELNRAFRARATASGFWALMACGAAAFLISFRSPNLLIYLLPFGLWLGGSVACIHFVWLHYQADMDLDDDG